MSFGNLSPRGKLRTMLSSFDLFAEASKPKLEEFGREFSEFRQSAKRLEVLPEFNVSDEKVALSDFLAGNDVDPTFNSGWHDILDAAKARGAHVERLRVLPENA